MVNLIGHLDGITASIIILTSLIFGLLSFINARKMGAKLLYYAGAMMIFIGLFWLGPFVEYMIALLLDSHIQPEIYYGWLSYTWVAPAIIIAMYLGSELLAPNKKKIIVGVFGFLGIIFAVLMYVFPSAATEPLLGTFEFDPLGPGDLLNSSFNLTSPTFWFVAIFLITVLIFEGIGFAIKAKQATGELRKKFTYLSIAFFVFVICGALDSILDPGIAIGFVRLVMATFSFWMYSGLRT
ncbi:MAG: hypothetical protein EU543_05745 [Promethearchaeota archaeon]|nr:MAG: hypothetical protein EU543_05745 [Candidatus Lokiarchaeota archaeon]